MNMLRTAVISLAVAVLGMLPLIAVAQLSTRSGFELGGQYSYYSYEEPSLLVYISGNKIGQTAAYTFARNRWFAKVDLRHAYGKLKYRGSGEKSAPDETTEMRVVGGRDFFPGSSISVSPYLGVGYRHLFNDLRGHTSSGAIGYRRYSEYWYLPLGVTARISANDRWVIVPSVEYDYFVRGKQESKLSDTNLMYYQDLQNTQKKGFGVRGSVLLEKGDWSFGPWVYGWVVQDSDKARMVDGSVWLEPGNWQYEVGLEVKYHF